MRGALKQSRLSSLWSDERESWNADKGSLEMLDVTFGKEFYRGAE